ncbi:MAG: T9SS type A sorting domain-containing protein [Chitinophagaceae bacterium]|jgi:hypothetical protein
MKKLLLILTLFVSFALSQTANGQCTVKDVVITINSTVQSGLDCSVNFNLNFMLHNNGGNKTVVIQAWKEVDYPDYWKCSSTGTSTVNKSPKLADLKLNGTGPLPFLNIAFDASTQSVISSANYPGGGVMLGSGYTVLIGAVQPDGFFSVTLNNLQVSVPNQICGAGVSIKADVWSSQGSITSQWTPHCVICGQSYAFNYPQVIGSTPCSLIDGITQRRFQFTVTNNNTSQSIEYTYKVYRDVDASGSLSAGDVEVFSETTPQALLAGQSFGYGPALYSGNQGLTIDQPVVVVLDLTGLNQRDYALFKPSCGTLPVSLKNFNAAKRTGKVALTWETESEISNDGFEIQRRAVNGTYKTIAFVDSKAPGGNSAGNIIYSFDDNENLPNGVTYYRLRQVDLDGKSIYSEIKAVRNNLTALFISVYPNPSRGTTNVAIPEGVGVVDVALEDFTGKLIQRWNGLNTRNLKLTNLKPGMYMLRVNARGSGEQVVERILIQ